MFSSSKGDLEQRRMVLRSKTFQAAGKVFSSWKGTLEQRRIDVRSLNSEAAGNLHSFNRINLRGESRRGRFETTNNGSLPESVTLFDF